MKWADLVEQFGPLILQSALKDARESGDAGAGAFLLEHGQAMIDGLAASLRGSKAERDQFSEAAFMAELAGNVSRNFVGLPLDVVAHHSVQLAALIMKLSERACGIGVTSVPPPAPESAPESPDEPGFSGLIPS